jgi:DNA-binding transcriptional LysR family regulator
VIPSNQTPPKKSKPWLNKQFWLLREPGSGTLEVSVRLLQKQGVKVLNSMQLGSNEAIARAVAEGMGIALLPNVVTEDLVQLGKLKRLNSHHNVELSRPLYQLRYQNRPSSHAAQAFEKSLFTIHPHN